MPTDDPTPSDALAKILYDGNAAPTPLPERPGEFYSWTPTGEVIKQRGVELFAHVGLDSIAQQRLQETFRTMERATGLPDALVARIAEGHINNLLAAARVSEDPDADDVALRQRIVTNNAALREELVTQYGTRQAEALLDRTQRFVREHPALAKMLQTRGLGSDPEIVRGIAHHVFITGWTG